MMTRKMIRILLLVGVLLTVFAQSVFASETSPASGGRPSIAQDTYVVQVCKKHGKTKVCHVEKKEKISDSVTYLDMSEVEGKVSEFPNVVPKGKL